jgi:hypothetical protein
MCKALRQFKLITIIISENEKDISAVEQEKKEQAWVQGKDVDSQRTKNIGCPPCKRTSKAFCFGRIFA